MDNNPFYEDVRNVAARVAARSISGRWCDVHFRDPPLKGCRGLAMRDGDRAVVFVDPDLEGDDMLATLLHELSHVRLHFSLMTDVNGKKARMIRACHVANVEDILPAEQEMEARDISNLWGELADVLAPDGNWLQKLNALSGYLAKRKKEEI